jgi:hypothetical protein
MPTLSLLHLTESTVRTKSQNEIKHEKDVDDHDDKSRDDEEG